MSGRYTHNHGLTDLMSAGELDQTTTLQYQLRTRGYKTLQAGKYLNNWVGDVPHFDRRAVTVGYEAPDESYASGYIRSKAIDYLDELEETADAPWLMYLAPPAPHSTLHHRERYYGAEAPEWKDTPPRPRRIELISRRSCGR
jgi:hypothetical protein